MAKKINRSEYDIRTLSYYQGLGGVYNDIITILVKMRNEAVHRGMPSPAQILNEASYWWDIIWYCWCGNNYKYQLPAGLNDNLIKCVLSCIASDGSDCRYYLDGCLDDVYFFVQSIQESLATDKVYYPKFRSLIETLQKRHKDGLDDLQSKVYQDKVKELNDIICQ